MNYVSLPGQAGPFPGEMNKAYCRGICMWNIYSRFSHILKAVCFQIRLGTQRPNLCRSKKARSCSFFTTQDNRRGGKEGSHCLLHTEQHPGACIYLLTCRIRSTVWWESDCKNSRGCEMTHQWLTEQLQSGNEKSVFSWES